MNEPETELLIDDIALTGEGVGHLPSGEAVFVPGTIAGEGVTVAVGRGRPRRGKLLRVARPSHYRSPPPCVHADRCGGCDFMHISAAGRAHWHAERVRRALAAALHGGSLPELEFHAPVEPLGYRTRARFHIEGNGRRAHVGYRPARSHELLAIDNCPVLSAELAPALLELGALFATSRGKGEAQAALGVAATGRRARVYEVRWRGDLNAELFSRIEAATSEGAIAGMRIWVEGARLPIVAGDPRPVVVGADGEDLIVAAGGFSQASDAGGIALAKRVAALAAEQNVARAIELYAGSGTLTVALAPAVSSLTAVEREETSVVALRDNLGRRGLKVRVRHDDADAIALPKLDLVVLDPPRAGASGAVAAIVAARPRRVIYVSCNPATLARDLSVLARARYRPTAIELFDLFPQTSHVEVLVALTR